MPTKPPMFRPPGWRPKDPAAAAAARRLKQATDNTTYGSAWRAVRKQFLAANPICCAVGCGKPATDADHILSARAHPDMRLSWSNLRPFCHSCHSRRTAREQGFGKTALR